MPLGGSPRATTYDLLGKVGGISNPVCGLQWKEGDHDSQAWMHPGSKAEESQVSCSWGASKLPWLCAIQLSCCATHPGQTHQVTPSYFLLHKGVLRKHQRWCNYLSGYSTGHKVSDTVKLPPFQTLASASSADASKRLWEEWVPLSFHWMESNMSFQLQA